MHFPYRCLKKARIDQKVSFWFFFLQMITEAKKAHFMYVNMLQKGKEGGTTDQTKLNVCQLSSYPFQCKQGAFCYFDGEESRPLSSFPHFGKPVDPPINENPSIIHYHVLMLLFFGAPLLVLFFLWMGRLMTIFLPSTGRPIDCLLPEPGFRSQSLSSRISDVYPAHHDKILNMQEMEKSKMLTNLKESLNEVFNE